MKHTHLLFAACLSSAVLAWLGACSSPPPPVSAEEQRDLFVTKVKPVLEYYCIECHTIKSGGKYGGLILEYGDLAMRTGRHAPVIHPGKPDESLLYIVLRLGHEQVLGMPPAPDKISDEELDGIRRWIRDGAQWPSGKDGHLVLPKG
jgi:hypothetical protein